MKQRADGRWRKTKVINGKTISFYSSEKTEKKALKDIEDQMLTYLERQSGGISFAEAAAQWEKEHREKVAYRTWMGYSPYLNKAVDTFGKNSVKNITFDNIQKFVNQMIKDGYSKKTIKTAISVLSMVFDDCISNGYLNINYANLIRLPNGLPQKQRELPSEDEIRKVIESRDCFFGDFAYLLLFTGMRRGEALALTIDDIDFEKNIIHIKHSVFFKSNQAVIKAPKTAAGIRDVFIYDNIRPIFENKKGYIFGKGDKPMSEQTFRCAWKRYIKESGVKITPHQLRHAHATLLHEIGIDVKSAQKMLGHADFQTTMQIYTHISETRSNEDFEKLNYQFSNKVKGSNNGRKPE